MKTIAGIRESFLRMPIPGGCFRSSGLLVLFFCFGPISAFAVNFNFGQESDPVTVFSATSEQVPAGQNRTTLTAPLEHGDLRFYGWFDQAGNRIVLSNGSSANPASIMVTEAVTLKAKYLPSTTDADDDGIPDTRLPDFDSPLQGLTGGIISGGNTTAVDFDR